MKESVFRGEMNRLLRRLHFWPLTSQNAQKCPSCGAVIKPKIVGRPDIPCLNPAEASIVAECKMFVHLPSDPYEKASLPFSKITIEQRTWLSNFQDDADERRTALGLTPWHSAYIALCTPHGRAGSAKSPRLAWLSTWKAWLEMEKKVLAARKSLPLIALRERDKNLGAVDLLKPWALEWINGGWAVGISHPLWIPELRSLEEFSKKWTKK